MLIRLCADRLIERDRLQNIEQLALVFMHPLDLHVEQRLRRHAHAGARVQKVGEPRTIIGRARRWYCATKSGIFGQRLELREAARIVEHTLAQPLDQQAR